MRGSLTEYFELLNIFNPQLLNDKIKSESTKLLKKSVKLVARLCKEKELEEEDYLSLIKAFAFIAPLNELNRRLIQTVDLNSKEIKDQWEEKFPPNSRMLLSCPRQTS